MTRLGAALAALALAVPCSARAPGRWEPGRVPDGVGPVSADKHPSYWKGLQGGALCVALAPVAFAAEAYQAAALSPVRMLQGVLRGRFLELLDPLRAGKNLALDALAVGVGVTGCAAAPLWNGLVPDESVDFMYSHGRLVFYGGPVAWVLKRFDIAKAIGPTWHTVFLTRNREKTKLEPGRNLYEHEFVHNKQIGRSFLFEHVGESYEGYAGWDDEDAHTYLNLF